VNIILVRHGETSYNVEGRMYGHAQVPLNQRGLLQAAAVGKRLKNTPFDAMYASDLVRAQHTAAAISAYQNVPVVFRDALREQHVGDWEHLTIPEVKLQFPDDYAAHMRDPANTPCTNGESFAMLQTRAFAELERIRTLHTPGSSICVVCHGGTINALVCAVLGLDIANHTRLWVDNCSLTSLRLVGTQFHLVRLNDNSHLTDIGHLQ
jgi:broad specificity phosphatase PhoE